MSLRKSVLKFQSSDKKLSGYLLKRGAGIRKGWKKRWFELDPEQGKLYYYDGPQPLGFIDIARAQAINIVENPDHPFEFTVESLVGQGGRVYHLAASSSYEMNCWLDELTTVMAKGNVGARKGVQLTFAEICELLHCEDYLLQVKAIKLLASTMAKSNKVEAEMLKEVLAFGRKELDCALQREIIACFGKSVLASSSLANKLTDTEVELAGECLQLIVRYQSSTSMEVQILALETFNYLIHKNEQLATKSIQIPNIWKDTMKLTTEVVNSSIRRKALQSLESLSYFMLQSNMIPVDQIDQKQLKHLVNLLPPDASKKSNEGVVNSLAQAATKDVAYALLGTLQNVSAFGVLKAKLGTKSKVKSLFQFYEKNCENLQMKQLLENIFVNLLQDAKVKEKMFAVASSSEQNLLNTLLPQRERKHYDRKEKNQVAFQDIQESQYEIVRERSKIPKHWNDILLDEINQWMKKMMESEGNGIKLEFTKLTMPTTEPSSLATLLAPNQNQSYVVVVPSFEEANEVKMSVFVKLVIKATISASKSSSVVAEMSQLELNGKVCCGFNGNTFYPSWISFAELPQLSTAITSEKLGVEKVLKTALEKQIQEHLLWPKKYFLGPPPKTE